jgi:hypothetical protein
MAMITRVSKYITLYDATLHSSCHNGQSSHVNSGLENSWDTQAGHVNKKKGLRFHVNP